MGDFFDSKFIKDLKDGKLPAVEVTIAPAGLVQLAGAIVIACVIVILINKIVKSI